MNNSKLKNVAWVFFALVLTTTTVFAQDSGYRNRNFPGQNGTCLELISNLSEKQKTQIQKLEENHQTEIAELRKNRRASFDETKKNEIRNEMLERVATHQSEVKDLLSADQQKEYELLHARGTNFRNQNGKNFQKGGRKYTGNQQLDQENRGGRRGNQARFNQGNRNNNQQNNACRGYNYRGKNRNGRGNGNRTNFSNS